VGRIARDRPDVLERMKQGEFLCVRQAAIAAGIVRSGTDQTLLVNAILISENRSPFSEKHYNMYSFVG
jgi:hypothetical protein